MATGTPGYYAKPDGSGYAFYDGSGNSISAQTYANQTGTNFSDLIHTLAGNGDSGAQQLINTQGSNLGAQELGTGIGTSFYWSGTGGADPTAQALIASENAGGSSATGYDASPQYWADQQSDIDTQLGRLPTQQQVGENNILSSYNAAYNTLSGQQGTANQNLSTSKSNTIQGNVTAVNNINDTVGANTTALQRLLQSRGAGGSSAYSILAPFAAAKQGNVDLGSEKSAYQQNLQAEDQAQNASDTQYTGAFGDLLAQKQNQEGALQSNLASTEAGLQQQKADAAFNAVQAAGGNYAAARAAESPYLTKANDLLSKIDQLGAQATFNPQNVTYTPPSLASYTPNTNAQIQANNAGVTPSQAQAVGPYVALIGGQKKDALGNPIS